MRNISHFTLRIKKVPIREASLLLKKQIYFGEINQWLMNNLKEKILLQMSRWFIIIINN